MSYDIKKVEAKWQEFWEKEGVYHFDFNSDKPVYSIDNPPRYASGRLHIGHAVHYTHIDFIARYRRMRGYNVFFPLCFDVNGMPIEVNVEKKYGIRMRETDRHEFVKLCEEFAGANIGEMTRQYRILGESMDPTIYYQTDAPYYRRITQMTFVEMFNKGLVYKAEHPVNWCPRCGTAIADAEIEYAERKTYLNYVRFRVKETGEDLIIATTRPELLCTCQLVAVHPEDERYAALVGKTAVVPIYGQEVKIVADEAVDPEFGTGAVMICSVGDKGDLEWIYKYGLKFIKGIDEEGRMTEIAGKYAGMTVEEAKRAIVEDLEREGLLIKREEIEQTVGTCWRCHTPIEFIQKEQWFIRIMDLKDEVRRAADEIRWFPEFMKKRLEDWIDSLQWDWVVSRQRYFATPIPVWECAECGHVVVPSIEQLKAMDGHVDPTVDPPPVPSCPKCGGGLKGCEDVFDTWVDSSISPLYNTFWMRDDEKFRWLYPMSLRPQAHDIIRTWAFYTILRCKAITGEIPWRDIFIDGFILGPDGRPMHASWGNVVDPLEIIDKYGADPFRYFATQCTLGEDTAFRYKDVVRGQRLVTKIWNIGRFVGGVIDARMEIKPEKLRLADRWILSKYARVLKEVTELLDGYRYDRAVKILENFLWREFADHYIEMVKHRAAHDEGAKMTLYTVALGLIKCFAPFLPHVTEEVYQSFFREHEGAKSIHISEWPSLEFADREAERLGEEVKEVIAAIRRWKAEKGIALNAPIGTVRIATSMPEAIEGGLDDIKGTVHAESVEIIEAREIEERVVEYRPNFSVAGPALRGSMRKLVEFLESTPPDEVERALEEGFAIDGVAVTREMLVPVRRKTYRGMEMEALETEHSLILIG